MRILYYLVVTHCFYLYIVYVYHIMSEHGHHTGNRYSLTGTHTVRRLRKHNTKITSYNMRYAIMYMPSLLYTHIYIIYTIRITYNDGSTFCYCVCIIVDLPLGISSSASSRLLRSLRPLYINKKKKWTKYPEN